MATANITPTSQITPDNDVLTLELFIAAPRERIFQALTDPAQASTMVGTQRPLPFHPLQHGRSPRRKMVDDRRVAEDG